VHHNIIPDYTLYSETQQTVRKNIIGYLPDGVKHSGMVVVYRIKCDICLPNRVNTLHLKSTIFHSSHEPVGLYAIDFASTILKSDDIHLIGYDYIGVDNNGIDRCKMWIEETKIFLTEIGKVTDHSGGDFPLS